MYKVMMMVVTLYAHNSGSQSTCKYMRDCIDLESSRDPSPIKLHTL